MQTYERGRVNDADNPRPSYLLWHYDDEESARNHLDACRYDPSACVLMLDDDRDWKELIRLGEKDAPELVYMALKPENAEAQLRRVMDDQFRSYIDHKLKWRIPSFKTVMVKLVFKFGDIYVEIRHGNKSETVKLEEIEQYRNHSSN
ncbi:MAG TPA: hypothetical protein VHM26_13400 [Chitinophagaceae bacterium]|jgi:hypothetical protein|nr:hypothetical protein [Chitinophagaceae bacterium]